jgi:tRNA dimethylallyltransferase
VQLSNYLIIIGGPTAIGKTSAAIEVAKHFQTEIISADSRQVYKELNVGVARPPAEQLHQVRHHLIADKTIHKNFSAGDYEREAVSLLDAFFKKKNIAVMCGGTGFYIDAVCNGLDDIPGIDADIRSTLNRMHKEEGIFPLQQKLRELDAETFHAIDLQNTQRVIRALEVCIGTGKPFSSFKAKNKTARNFMPLKIGLNTAREKLYRNIEYRVEQMMQNGLIEEAESLYPFKAYNALQTVGYRELFAYFSGEVPLEQSVEKIKQHTRNYAKRQLTWFGKDKSYQWFDPEQLPEIIRYLEGRISAS